MPFIYLLAGPNGAGKTTFYMTAVQTGFIRPELPFINVDLLAKQLGSYSDENYNRAQDIYRSLVSGHLKQKEDFMIESNLADSRSYDWLTAMKKAGYEAILYFLSTDDVEVNVARVAKRVIQGGHDIPQAIIRIRYAQSHSYLKTKLREFREVYLIDSTNIAFEVQAQITNGVIVNKEQERMQWVRDILSITERLDNRNKQ